MERFLYLLRFIWLRLRWVYLSGVEEKRKKEEEDEGEEEEDGGEDLRRWDVRIVR
jgi:hypothetical protein